MDGPVTHVDFTNTNCIQTFNGANVVSLCHFINCIDKGRSLLRIIESTSSPIARHHTIKDIEEISGHMVQTVLCRSA